MSNSLVSLSIPQFIGREREYVKKCVDSGWVSSAGRLVEDFEKAICKYTKARYAVSCINGSSGLFLALKLVGTQPGEEVIVPTLTFIAPVNAVRHAGAEPIFMDCDGFMNIDAEKLKEFCRHECALTKGGLKNRRTNRIIRTIIVVHVFGNPCGMSAIMNIAERYRLKVIEDATESLGSYYTSGRYDGRHTGTIGDLGIYSFNGNKIITSGGGGMIVTSSKRIADEARYLSTQAKDDSLRSIHHDVGYNFRLSSIQAALGLAQLEKIERFIKAKKSNYNFYLNRLKNVDGLQLMPVPPKCRPNYWLYSLIIDKKAYGIGREELMNKLAKKNIETRPIWYLNHRQKPYLKNQAYKIEKAFWFWEKVLNVPSSSSLGVGEIKRITDLLKNMRIG